MTFQITYDTIHYQLNKGELKMSDTRTTEEKLAELERLEAEQKRKEKKEEDERRFKAIQNRILNDYHRDEAAIRSYYY